MSLKWLIIIKNIHYSWRRPEKEFLHLWTKNYLLELWLDLDSVYVCMDKNACKLSSMVGEIFEIYWFQVAKNAFKLSTMIGENFEIYSTQVAKEMHSNCPPWLQKFLKYTYLQWIKNACKLSTMVGENFEI